MPYLSSLSPSISKEMSTTMHYHTTLIATWKSGSTYAISLSITREEARTESEKNAGLTVGWSLNPSNDVEKHSYKIKYIGADSSGNPVEKTIGENALSNAVQVRLNDVAGEDGWAYRTTEILNTEITVHPTKGKVTALYNATVDNRSISGSIDKVSFWAPNEDLDKVPLLPGPPNVLVRTGGEWKRAKDIWIYRNKAWRIIPSGHLNVYTNGKWTK